VGVWGKVKAQELGFWLGKKTVPNWENQLGSGKAPKLALEKGTEWGLQLEQGLEAMWATMKGKEWAPRLEKVLAVKLGRQLAPTLVVQWEQTWATQGGRQLGEELARNLELQIGCEKGSLLAKRKEQRLAKTWVLELVCGWAHWTGLVKERLLDTPWECEKGLALVRAKGCRWGLKLEGELEKQWAPT
jgi:hypothetical protein